jgi:hypothetical protein
MRYISRLQGEYRKSCRPTSSATIVSIGSLGLVEKMLAKAGLNNVPVNPSLIDSSPIRYTL